VEEQCKHS